MKDFPTYEDVVQKPRSFNRAWFKKKFPMQCEEINNISGTTFSEKLYRFLTGDSGICQYCGKPSKFISFTVGYQPYCSSTCAAHSPSVNDKKKKTCLKNHGVLYPSQSTDVRKKIEASVRSKYGVDNVSQSDVVKLKKQETYLKNWGVTNPMQNSDLVDKLKDSVSRSNMNKYGVKNTSSLTEVQNKILSTIKQNFLLNNEVGVVDYTEDGDWIVKCDKKCPGCGGFFITYNTVHTNRIKSNIEQCTILNPIHKQYSCAELELAEYISSLGYFIERNLNCLYFDGPMPKQIDVLLPRIDNSDFEQDKHPFMGPIGFEYNGVYFHSLEEKEPDYHLKKWKSAREKGIRLVTIWEHWWNDRNEDCKRFIKDQIECGKSNVSFFDDNDIHIDTCSYDEWKSIDPSKIVLYKQLINNHAIIDSGKVTRIDGKEI